MGSEHRWRYGRSPPQLTGERAPAEAGAGVGLAAGRDVLVADHGCHGVAAGRGPQQAHQRNVLGRFESGGLEPLEFDADRVVVAVFAVRPT